ncbi:MAG: hypothetical protein LBV08_04085, partial [Clostridiales bacterium]|nr:hypothetical protein [Clostridiales bacterium]
EIIRESGNELTEEAKGQLLSLGLTQEQIDSFADMQNNMPGMGGGGQNGRPGMMGQSVAEPTFKIEYLVMSAVLVAVILSMAFGLSKVSRSY